MFIACLGHVSHSALLLIPLHSVIADIGDNQRPLPHIRDKEGFLYVYFVMFAESRSNLISREGRCEAIAL
jgi:hypothetical protein